MHDEALLRFNAVAARVGYGRTTIYGLIKQGKFPAPVRLAGGGAVAWKASAISAWIEAQGKQTAAA